MGAVATKQRTVENIVRLRRAERARPGDADVLAVRLDLERAAGPTVSRAIAARLLGVSQPAFARWEASTDIPVVTAPSGRREVPLRALVALVEEVEEHKRESQHGRRHLAAVLHDRRSRAESLDIGPPTDGSDVERPVGHSSAERQGLLYHRAVARRLDESLVRDARERLSRWRSEGRIHPRPAERWEEILAEPIEAVAQHLFEDSETMRELHQSSPFTGALSEPERRALIEFGGRGA